ncbi:hypothetical protein LTR84_003896 [Exophiala bonariae]|uniref:Importin N-terminal domain-containing protein n=1 Tax=Exophiala bonariae TaxID=1690606 RepID=A0AAV9N6E3_9EURO|nr:hypothetical protein LTR84_003896 [Exophiala bonariae]
MNQRQEAFQQLRSPCVELSSVVLKFKTNQVASKAVLLALEPVHHALDTLGQQGSLDHKLAEYAFFPLTQILNQSKQLPSQVLELTLKCIQILVSKGWKDQLAPQMAKQLLILMSLLTSSESTSSAEPPTDDLKVAAFGCMHALLHQVAQRDDSASSLDEIIATSLLDRLVYQLLEDMSITTSESVQLSAAKVLLELQGALANPVTLASLLPRTVSMLVKVLRPSTKARRTQKVLVTYLQLLTEALRRVLSDNVLSERSSGLFYGKTAVTDDDKRPVLDKSWLDATAPQIDIALTQVIKLRSQRSPAIDEALLQLCLVVIEDCSQSLHKSLPLMVETLTVLCRSNDSSKAVAALNHLMLSRPIISDVVSAKFFALSQALPRVMQGNDERPKEHILGQLATSFTALSETTGAPEETTSRIASVLIDSVAVGIESSSQRLSTINGPNELLHHEFTLSHRKPLEFEPLLLSHQSQQSSTGELNAFIHSLSSHGANYKITRNLINQMWDPDLKRRVSAIWLALRFLEPSAQQTLDLDDYIQVDHDDGDWSLTRPYLVSDLYAQTIPYLLQYADQPADQPADSASDWRLVGLALESLVLQANQLRDTYRPELMETLFPLLVVFGSPHTALQRHATTALDLLARACNYASAMEMLIENVDYLINSVAMRLNSFDVSQAGLQVLAMMIRLCGADLLPHLDDVIGSIFSTLDSYHGYPKLVEYLFLVLKLVVDESSKNPTNLAIEEGSDLQTHSKRTTFVSTISDIVLDLNSRRTRTSKMEEEPEQSIPTPHQPWKSNLEHPRTSTNEDAAKDEDDGDLAPNSNSRKDEEKKLSKSHQLLIQIVEATIPHMSSPSAKVRHTLLEILRKICPVLAAHETSFLPLINSIWPSLASRVLGQQDKESPELPYNVQAAVETVTIICEYAGDFMASRVDELLTGLEALFKRITVPAKISARAQSSIQGQGSNVSTNGPPSLYVIEQEKTNNGRGVLDQRHIRPSEQQILSSLVTLFGTILRCVRISEDNVDKLFDLLGPYLRGSGNLQVWDALEQYNSDFVWLLRLRWSQ